MAPDALAEKLMEKFGKDNSVVFWKHDNDRGNWESFSSGAPSELNDLQEISEGDEVWVIVSGSGMTFIRALMTFDGRSFVISLGEDMRAGDIRRSVFPGFP